MLNTILIWLFINIVINILYCMCLPFARLRLILVVVRLDMLGEVMAKVVVERAPLLHPGDME